MLTGEIRNQVDRIRGAFWTGGISNPLEVTDYSLEDKRTSLNLSRHENNNLPDIVQRLEKRASGGAAGNAPLR